MATAKKPAKTLVAKKATSASRGGSKSAAAGGEIRPIKEAFTKSALALYVAEQAGVEPRTARAVLAALHKKGAGEFMLLGLVKITAQEVPAKARRFGKDPFMGAERWFEAKPA